MGDHHRCSIFRYLFQRGLNFSFSPDIECRCCLIKHKHRWVFKHRSRNRYPLFLTSGQFQPALTHSGLIALGQAENKLVNAREPSRIKNLLFSRIRATITNVVGNRVIEQHGILRNDSDSAAETGLRHISDVVTINRDFPSIHIVETIKQSG